MIIYQHDIDLDRIYFSFRDKITKFTYYNLLKQIKIYHFKCCQNCKQKLPIVIV